MPDFEKMYFNLFGAITDALEHMEQNNYGLARQRLVAAQQEGEERYMEDESSADE